MTAKIDSGYKYIIKIKIATCITCWYPTQSCIFARAIRKKKKNNTKSDRDIN